MKTYLILLACVLGPLFAQAQNLKPSILLPRNLELLNKTLNISIKEQNKGRRGSVKRVKRVIELRPADSTGNGSDMDTSSITTLCWNSGQAGKIDSMVRYIFESGALVAREKSTGLTQFDHWIYPLSRADQTYPLSDHWDADSTVWEKYDNGIWESWYKRIISVNTDSLLDTISEYTKDGNAWVPQYKQVFTYDNAKRLIKYEYGFNSASGWEIADGMRLDITSDSLGRAQVVDMYVYDNMQYKLSRRETYLRDSSGAPVRIEMRKPDGTLFAAVDSVSWYRLREQNNADFGSYDLDSVLPSIMYLPADADYFFIERLNAPSLSVSVSHDSTGRISRYSTCYLDSSNRSHENYWQRWHDAGGFPVRELLVGDSVTWDTRFSNTYYADGYIKQILSEIEFTDSASHEYLFGSNTIFEYQADTASGVIASAAQDIQAIQCFPNPASQTLYLRGLERTITKTSLSVCDPAGKTLIHEPVTTELLKSGIDISALRAGVYILKIEGTRQVSKFIKTE